jgi:hypothetical protein
MEDGDTKGAGERSLGCSQAVNLGNTPRTAGGHSVEKGQLLSQWLAFSGLILSLVCVPYFIP